MKDKIMMFAQLVSEINISKYEQKEYRQIVKELSDRLTANENTPTK